MIPLTIPEIKRLLAALTIRPVPPWHVIHWDAWTRRHQARSRWFHKRAKLARDAEPRRARGTGADTETAKELLRKRDEARVAHAAFRGRDLRSRMAQGQAKVQQTYNDLVRDSTLIRHFETVYVPGLLQVPEYARRVLNEMIELHQLEIDDVDAAVAVRMQRQQFLYDPRKQFEFLLAEPVLRFLLVPPAVMRAQLDRLQTIVGLEHVRFGIVPMGTVLTSTPQASVQIYVGEETIAVAEDFAGETWHREDAEAYARGVDRMWEEAVEGDRARELIIRAAQALPG